ncbi:hypothetical protein ACN2WE_04230 [Streptomyces sp. cg28]|uniref:hypothetical protein n=1 Tax=Streptomyces sp. cg28 TaxID=3403457 RepID=UPI003B228294
MSVSGVPFDCGRLLTTTSSTQTIVWNTGQSSTLSTTTGLAQVEGNTVATSTGTVIGGLFAGQSVLRTVTYLGLDLQQSCLSPTGLAGNAGPVVLKIGVVA